MSAERSYAKALFETARDMGLKEADFETIQSDLGVFASLVSHSPDLKYVLESPVLSVKDKVSIAEEIGTKAGLSKLVLQFISLVTRKNRGSFFEALPHEFLSVRYESEGTMIGSVVSAEPLKAADLQDLTESFAKKFGRRVHFDATVDSSLLAGIKVTLSGVTYDGSVRAQLQQLKDQLVYGAASRENN